MPTKLPKRFKGRSRGKAVAPALSSGDVNVVQAPSSRGVNVPTGAFGQQEGQALEQAGRDIAFSGRQIGSALSTKKQRQDKQINALDKNRVNSGKLLIDGFEKRTQKRIGQRPTLDKDGVEIDQQAWTNGEVERFQKEILTPQSSRLIKPENKEQLEVYFQEKLRNLQFDSNTRAQVGRADKMNATLLSQKDQIKSFVAENPRFREDEFLQEEFTSKIFAAKEQLRSMVQSGVISQADAQKIDIDFSNDIGQIQVDQEISRLKILGSREGAQRLVRRIRSGEFNLKGAGIQKNIDKVLDATTDYFEKAEKEAEESQEKVIDRQLSKFYKKPTRDEFEALTTPGEDPVLEKGKPKLDREGDPITVLIPALITDPKEIRLMKNAVDGVENSEKDRFEDLFVTDIQNRDAFEGFNAKENFALFRKQAVQAFREGKLDSDGFERVSEAINAWEKESSTEAGKRLSQNKKKLATAVKGFIDPNAGNIGRIFGGPQDLNKISLINDLTRLGQARLERAEKNRAEGKEFESFPFILDDLRTRISRNGKDFLIPDETRENIRKKTSRGERLSDVEAEQFLLIRRLQDLNRSRQPSNNEQIGQ
jgi:hypothetical protein